MRRFLCNAMLWGAALLPAALVPQAAAQAPARGEPVKLGMIDIYSGGFAFIADSIRTGFQIALDEANAAGGFKGRPFQLVTADMGTQVEKAVTEGRRMILEEKIKFVTVGIHSGAAIAVGNLGKEHKVLVLGGFATTKRLTGEAGHPYVARANLSTVEIGSVIAAYIKGRPDIKRVATMAPDYEYGQQFVEDFVRALKAARPDVTVVRQEWSKLGATDFSAHVTALQAQPVDMIINGGFGADLVNFLKAARDFGLFSGKTQLFTHGVDLAKMGALKDSLPANTVSTVWFPFYALKEPRAKPFAAEVEKRMKTYATGPTPVGYVAGRMLVEAIKKAGTADDVEKVLQAMGSVSFEGPTGPVKVRACDNMAMYNFYVGTVKRDASYPDGIGMADVKTFPVEQLARPCLELLKARGTG
ncbi:MAG: ABC transporter substrate-binding protein [Burkholderiales bacterium]|nr:ABC transporter substrate-binding protein [Burkholderiales bacterium]